MATTTLTAPARLLSLLSILLLLLHASQQQQLPFTDTAAGSPLRLTSPHVGDDGRVHACYGKTLLAFETNGTLAWTLPLPYYCRPDVAPLGDGTGKVMYLLAEDRVLKITPSNVRGSEPAVDIFFGPDSAFGGSGEIVGVCISVWNSVIFINVKRRGLFALSLRGQLMWSAGPVLYRFGLPQGCKENVSDCYFSSAPAFDQCEGNIYIANNQGQLYSMYSRSPHFMWIKDLSFIDKAFTITPGNNGRLYLTFTRRALLMALDVSSGNILWQNNVGPLSREDCYPVVDSNGWVSIGSLDGYLYSISPSGTTEKFLTKTSQNSVVQVSPILDCSGFAIYVSQTEVTGKFSHTIGEETYVSALQPTGAVFTMLVPATGAIYWTGKYPGEVSSMLSKTDLTFFRMDENIVLAFLASFGMDKYTPSYTTRRKLEWTCSQAKPKSPIIYTGNERTILLFILFQLVVIILLAVAVRFCCLFWQKKKLQEQNLGKFLERRHTLHKKRQACRRRISGLQQEANAGSVSNEVLEQLDNIVRAKAAIERKLTTTYSLGRDITTGLQRKSILPLYDGKSKSYSFHSASKESVTIFDTLDDASTSQESSSSSGDDGGSASSSTSSTAAVYQNDPGIVDLAALKGKAPMEGASSSKATDVDEIEFSVLANPLFSEPLRIDGAASEPLRAKRCSPWTRGRSR